MKYHYNMKNLILFFLLSMVLLSCKKDQSSSDVSSIDNQLASDSSVQGKNKALEEINKLIIANKGDKGQLQSLLEKGLKVSTEANLQGKSAGYLTSLLREFPNHKNQKEHMFSLATIMRNSKRTSASSILFKGFSDQFPNDTRSEEAKKYTAETFTGSPHDYLLNTAKGIFNVEDHTKINRQASLDYVNACEAYALANKDEKAPEYLYKASEVARSLSTYRKALSLFDWIIEQYPNFEKAPTCLFLKGFVIENELKNEDLARQSYELFLDKYPSDELADDVKFLLDNLGKTDEEMLKMIEENRAKAGQ